MLVVQINDTEVKQLCIQKIEEKINEMDLEMVYWDAKELKRRTSMCWNSIQSTFFFDQNFPKFKIGQKWYFPARETRIFLENWIRNQKK